MTAASDVFPENPPARVASVDGVRGWLATYVMVAHLVNAYGSGILIGGANTAVMIFFVISGYVLTRSWTGNVPGFVVRRFFRLWPVYALSLAAGGYMIGKAPPLLFFFWYPFETKSSHIPYNPVMWSLFVEAWSTLFMPLIVWIGRRRMLAAAAIVTLTLLRLVNEDLSYGAYFILGSCLAHYTPGEKYFSDPVSQWLGRISYSLYLTHLLVLAACKFHFPSVALYIAIPASFAFASLVWFLVERPSIYLSRRLGRLADRHAGPVWSRMFRGGRDIRTAPV
jgi:peptidoglycan/LPS O-acetylase OafA/YrhL